MPKLQRRMIAAGECYVVECAVRADRSEPAKEFLDLLKVGMWKDDPDSDSIPDDEQIQDWAVLLDKIKYLAKQGEPERKDDINYLDDGLWEFKVASKRLAFFDTPGDGSYEAKAKIIDRASSPHEDSWAWWVPDFDDYIRLANYWPKTEEKAGQFNIEEGRKIREEDLSHDR